MIKAFFLDFYGTVVYEDGEIIQEISQIIYETGDAKNTAEIGQFWWNEFQNMCLSACGENFETQRALEYRSLGNTIAKFHGTADPGELSERMFEYWRRPPIFGDAKEFFTSSSLPVYIVSNIDTEDIRKALEYHHLSPAGVFTSEDARAYKPREELFQMALGSAGLRPEEVVHIGDSISSDVRGASQLGIRALWLNRFQKEAPEGVEDIHSLLDALRIISS